MNPNSLIKSLFTFLFIALAFFFMGTSGPISIDPNNAYANGNNPKDKGTEIVSLKDFTKEEVRVAGITLSKDLNVHINAVGGGDKSFWSNLANDNESEQMYAAGWIINADTRELVWDMTMDNTSGRSNRRTCEENLTLKAGSYEVYFMAYGYSSGTNFSHWSANIDRRRTHHSSDRLFGGLLNIFTGNSEENYDDFMEYAKDTWGITLSVPPDDASAVSTFDAPRSDKLALLSKTRVGDDVVFRKDLNVDREVKLRVYAVGEGQRSNDVNDFGWIVNTETRERVWDMSLKDVRYAGGAHKNIKFDGDVTLPKGTYELVYVSDDSHSNDDWNARPPYDPFNYGITISLTNAKDRDAVKITDPTEEDKNVIVKLTEMRDNDYRSAGFSLKQETKVRVYALGESVDNNSEMADYGWIMNTGTREKVWKMEARESYHAGGAEKNRLFDEVITLPEGNYLACYQTDDSHSYDDWNADAPFDPKHWGLTIMGLGAGFDPKSVSAFTEDNEKGVIAQLIRVRDDEHVHQTFSLKEKTRIHIYALGEADGDELADYGWIRNVETGERVWHMNIDETSWAGGAKKNRLFDKSITLDKGDYEVHFKTDDSHAYGDWNDDPPDDRTHWGITIYSEQ